MANRHFTCFLILASLAGCVSLRAPDASEIAFQAMNAVDLSQSIAGARHPDKYYESDPVTSRLIGHHPTQGATYAAMLGYAAVHYLVSNWLAQKDGRGWHDAYIAWQALTIGNSVYNVAHNASIGIRPFSVKTSTPVRVVTVVRR